MRVPMTARRYIWTFQRHLTTTKPLWNQNENTDAKMSIPLISKPINESDTIIENPIKANGFNKNVKDDRTNQISVNLRRWIESQRDDKEFHEGLDYEFKVFDQVRGNLIRRQFPPLPPVLAEGEGEEGGDVHIDLDNEEVKSTVIDFMRNLTEYTYRSREINQSILVRKVWDKTNKLEEVQRLYLKYLFKKNDMMRAVTLISEFNLLEKQSTYEILFDRISIFKNSKSSLKELCIITSNLSKYKIEATPKLIYKIYYAIPQYSKLEFLSILKEKNFKTEEIIFDKEFVKEKTFDSISYELAKGRMELTYHTYFELVNSMTKEHRIEEGLMTINRLIMTKRVEIPATLAIYTVDKIISIAAYHGISSAMFLQRLTGQSLKLSTIQRLLSIHISSGILNERSITLFHLLAEEHGKKDRHVYHLKLMNKINSIKNGVEREKILQMYDMKNKGSEEDIAKYQELRKLFKIYVQCDVTYSAGFEIEIFEPIFDLFNQSSQFITKRENLMKGLEEIEEFKLSEFWMAEISPISQDRKASFIRCCGLITDILLERNQYHQIIPFVEYVKEVNKIDISYNAYLKTILNIVKRPDMKDATIESSPMMQLVALLSFHIHLRGKMMYQTFLKDHSNLNELLNELTSSKYQSVMKSKYLEIVNDVKWDTTSAPELSISPYRAGN